ncbi:flagellar biosynthetic protein FliR [Marinicrinis lubricantis]|uniref:Flagellar biosynthetic protein FliR n=1 Tax=Marinicrinis lubricantis TaxID=2086470 RepID=A0ABW1IMF3_9BACL
MVQWFLDHLPHVLLVFCRITSFFVVAPIYSYRGVPAPFKIGFSSFIALITFAAISFDEPVTWTLSIIPLILKEVAVGLMLGFLAYLFFTVVQIAGSFIDMQMGLGIANVVDPMTGAQSPIIGNFKFYLMTLIFLSMNGHHYLITAIMKSYQWVPINSLFFANLENGSISEFILNIFIQCFTFAFQMSAPIIAALFLTDVALGILAKTSPQFNVFVIGLPLKIIVGFLLLIVVIPGLLYLFTQLFESMFQEMERFLKIMGA